MDVNGELYGILWFLAFMVGPWLLIFWWAQEKLGKAGLLVAVYLVMMAFDFFGTLRCLIAGTLFWIPAVIISLSYWGHTLRGNDS